MKILLLIILIILYVFIGMIIGALFHVLSNLDSIKWYEIIVILFWPPIAIGMGLFSLYVKLIKAV